MLLEKKLLKRIIKLDKLYIICYNTFMDLLPYLKKFNTLLDKGIKLPLMYDPITDKPSVTLMFPYFSFILLMISLALLVKENTLYGAIGVGSVWVLATVFYLLRKLTKFKADLDDKSIELEGGDESK